MVGSFVFIAAFHTIKIKITVEFIRIKVKL